jgi:hypothetical protein
LSLPILNVPHFRILEFSSIFETNIHYICFIIVYL